MSFIENLRGFIAKREPALSQIKSEDQAKLALVFPFLRHLGYDTTDPSEVIPEYTADVATKKGEKVDIAIMVDSEPAILIECKAPGSDLNSYNGQLYRYFSVTPAKFAILTNGLEYLFFSDVDAPNKLDNKPFMSVNLFDATDSDLQELHRFEKSNFNPIEVAETAEQLKKMNLMKGVIARELREPSDDLIRHFSREVNAGRLTQAKLEEFRIITQKAIKEHFREYLNNHIQKAMDRISDDTGESTKVIENEVGEEGSQSSGVTEEEINCLLVIKAILSRKIKPDRISLRDAKSYNTILLDQKPRKRLAIFKFGRRKNVVEILDRQSTRAVIEAPDDLFQYSNAFEEALETITEDS